MKEKGFWNHTKNTEAGLVDGVNNKVDLDQIQKVAFETMGHRQVNPQREPGYIYYHGQRVGKIALQLRELIFPFQDQDDGVILVGGWFHDVGKGIEPHWEYGALLVERILGEHCSVDQLEQIREIVGNHTLRKEKEYPHYVQLVQDGDILDHFGSQEIWLNFWHTAYHKQNLDYALEFYETRYQKQVVKVRELLNFEESVEFFNEKDRFVRSFVERLRKEGMGDLVGYKGKD
ncbi:MAG: HD domain-containing protein [Firmicutes bacterium]|nr:HD domain-containing protein [Bacillota bacterium]